MATGPAEAQRRIDAWVAAGDPTAFLRLAHLELRDADFPNIPDTVQRLYLGSNRFTTIPRLPRDLERLDVSYSRGLTQLPQLPANLKVLVVDQNREMTQLPELPAGLEHLSAQYSSLTGLPELPNSLTYLDCSNLQRGFPNEAPGIRELPPLPAGLRTLKCQYAGLRNFPDALPPTLVELNCSGNYIGYREDSTLPELPPTLTSLRVYGCGISILPPLPNGLQVLNCGQNYIRVLPELPPGLQELDCSYLPLAYFPRLPLTITRLTTGNLNHLNPPFSEWVHRHNLPYHMAQKIDTREFIRLVNEWHDSLEPKNEGRNLARLARILPRNANTPANWYAGPPKATVEALGIGNVRSVLGSMLSGRKGTVAQQRNQLRRTKNLRLQELRSRPIGGPGVGGRRRKYKKTKRNRK